VLFSLRRKRCPLTPDQRQGVNIEGFLARTFHGQCCFKTEGNSSYSYRCKKRRSIEIPKFFLPFVLFSLSAFPDPIFVCCRIFIKSSRVPLSHTLMRAHVPWLSLAHGHVPHYSCTHATHFLLVLQQMRKTLMSINEMRRFHPVSTRCIGGGPIHTPLSRSHLEPAPSSWIYFWFNVAINRFSVFGIAKPWNLCSTAAPRATREYVERLSHPAPLW